MNSEQLLEIVLAEAARRESLKRSFDPKSLLDPNFKHQNDFINDPAKLKALFCTRRAAKSYTAGLYMIKEALENPGVNCLFIGLTRLSAEGIVWKDILKVINAKHNLGMQFNNSKLTATFPNGSVIWLAGVDTHEDEMRKLLGKKYKLVCLDEASLYTINLHLLIYGILKPAVADNRGTICMMGTSSNITRGLFYDITTGVEQGWNLHTWSAFDNPHMAVQWGEEIQEIKEKRPLFQNTTLYKQWYLNEWVVDQNALVYKFELARNLYTKRPQALHPEGWTFILGVDLGYEDDSAFVVATWHENERTLYIVATHNQKHMDITDVANKIKELQKTYGVAKIIIDGANKQAVEEIQHRHQVPLEPADKTGKADFIEILNAELIQGRVKIHEGCKNLIDELQTLIWETDGEKIKLPKREHPALPNHLCDAFLYAWRFSYQYLSEPADKKVVVGSKAWHDQINENLFEKALEHFENEKSKDWGQF